MYYWAKLYTEQLKTTEDYSLLSKAIGIHILNFTSIPEGVKYHNVFHIREKESNLLYFKDLELHTIELTKFSSDNRAQLDEILKKVKTSLDMWSAFLTRHDLLKKDPLPAPFNDPSLQKALHVLEVMNFGPEEREAYEGHLKWLRIEMNTLKKAEDKGFEKGKELGIQEGEKKERLEIAQKMLQQGFSFEQIVQITGLSPSDFPVQRKG